jgi:hypothetical protein
MSDILSDDDFSLFSTYRQFCIKNHLKGGFLSHK